MKGLSECKASESNVRSIQVKDIVKEIEYYLKTYKSAGMDISWVDTMPVTTDPINTTNTTNVSQSVVNENLPQLLDSRGGSHVINVIAFDKEDFTSWKVRDIKITIQASNSKALISNHQFQDNDSDAEEDQRTSNEFMADLNAKYHERALLENQKRFYKRSGRVGSARKTLDKTKETCFACGKLGHFQKDCPSHKTSTPSYPSSNNSFKKSKPYTPSFNQTSSQNLGNHQKDYKGKYKGLKAKMVVLTKRIDDMTNGKSKKGNKDKEKSEKGLLAESFNWDDESVSSDDEGSTKIRAFMEIENDDPQLERLMQDLANGKVTLDQLLFEQVLKNIVKALGGEGKRKEKISSKEVVFTKADESSSTLAPEITSDSESKCDSQEPLPPLPKLIGAPSGTSESLISLFDLTLNMADLTLDTPKPKKTRPSVKVSPAYVIKKKTEKSPADPIQCSAKKADSSTKQLLLTLMEE
nr:hypothetical protein [Tanacetum cinerariifolium]